MRKKLKPGRKKGSFTDPEKWEAKQREVDEFYVKIVGGTLAPGDHMVDTTHASKMIRDEYEKGPSPSDIVEKFKDNTKSDTTNRKGYDISDVFSGFNIAVMENTKTGSLYDANVTSYEVLDPQYLRFWMPKSDVLPWQASQLARAGVKRVAHLLSEDEVTK